MEQIIHRAPDGGGNSSGNARTEGTQPAVPSHEISGMGPLPADGSDGRVFRDPADNVDPWNTGSRGASRNGMYTGREAYEREDNPLSDGTAPSYTHVNGVAGQGAPSEPAGMRNDAQSKKGKGFLILMGIIIVVLLIVVAFLLGKNSGGNNGGAGRDPSGNAAVSGETLAPAELTGDAGDSDPTQSAPDNGGAAVSEQDTASVTQAAQTPAVTTPSVPSQAAGMPATLDIDMTSGSLTFEKGAQFDVKYDSTVIRVQQNGSGMTIANDHSNPSAAERKRMDVVVTVPEGSAFTSLDITFGAGKLISYTLPAAELRLELGAGSATLENVVVTGSATVKSGAGAFAIKSGSIANLDLQCGAGATQVQAALTGSSRITAAVGAADLRLEGSESDYTVSFNMSLGACYFNDTKIARGGSFGTGPNTVDITGGLGVMRVTVG